MPTLTVDGIEVTVEAGSTVLQACEAAGVEIPRFCFHDRLSVAGNCRMCLVEMEKAPKPVASCAMPAGDGMVVKTTTERVKKAREGVMEFLLLNHPLDCPICDQGGECDLQDQSMAYGRGASRTKEHKRAVTEKYMGPVVSTVMTRCIHCTRCVRFVDEVAGTPVLGGVFRGENTEITTYVESAINSELSGNIVDLCPVGALTSKPYKFKARPWELRKTESIDVMDAVGSNIRVDSRGKEVMRILPRLHEDVNEEWISDKTRHVADGLTRRRLDRPYVRDENGKLQAVSWAEAFAAIKAALDGVSGPEIAALAGDLACVESMVAMSDLLDKLGSGNKDCRTDGAQVNADVRASYLFNSSIAGVEEADAILIVGSNPRWEAPLINARIRKRYLMGGLKVGLIGPQLDLTYKYEYLGAGAETLAQVADGSHGFAQLLQAAKRPMIILGSGVVARSDGAALLALARQIAETSGMVVEATDEQPAWNGFNVLQRAASRVGGLDVNFTPADGGLGTVGIVSGARSGAVKGVFLMGVDDDVDLSAFENSFTVYMGSHGDAGVRVADVILPAAAYTEKEATYVTTEGRVQQTVRAHYPLGEAREDWTILRALSEVLGQTLPYDNIAQVRARMVELAPQLAELDVVIPSAWGDFGTSGATDSSGFELPITDFYLTNPIARASEVMAECSRILVHGETEEATGTHG